MPKVSVILTSYNHEKYIAEAIDSALAQTFTDFELLIVDDSSTDSSWEIIKSYKDPRIIAIRNETNRRKIVYHNLHRCKGEYIAVHHSDDVWLPEKLEKQVKCMDESPGTTACFTWVQYINEEGKKFNPISGFYTEKVFNQPNRNRFEWLNTFFYEGNRLCHPSILIRSQAYSEYGLFTEGLAQIPDFVQWIRLCLNAEIHIIQQPLTLFRLRDNQANTSGERVPAVIRSSIELYLSLREYLKIPEHDFCKVFPEAAAYQSQKGLMVEYAFASLCQQSNDDAKKLFGMEILYSLLNDTEKSAMLEEMYGFGVSDFFRITERHDVFKCITENRMQKSCLYMDFGDGFLQKNKVSRLNYLPSSNHFFVEFDLSEYQNIKALRFCPQEDGFSCCHIHSVMADGNEYKALPVGSSIKKDGFDFMLAPLYHISNVGKRVAISGEINYINVQQAGVLSAKLCECDKTKNSNKKILYGCGYYGKLAFDYYGDKIVFAFADMNQSGGECLGKPVFHPDELATLSGNFEVIICVKEYDDVIEYLNSIGLKKFNIFSFINYSNRKFEGDENN